MLQLHPEATQPDFLQTNPEPVEQAIPAGASFRRVLSGPREGKAELDM